MCSFICRTCDELTESGVMVVRSCRVGRHGKLLVKGYKESSGDPMKSIATIVDNTPLYIRNVLRANTYSLHANKTFTI